MSENLTNLYKNYAVYLPSIQQQYAELATRSNKSFTRLNLPKNFKFEDINFLNENSKLWSCGWGLYSSGQFDKAQIRKNDIVKDRDRTKTTIIGDSGGFQLGTGAISNTKEKEHLERYKHDANEQIANWADSGFRERTLKWLDRYADYAVTLDMVLWAAESFNAKHTVDSQIRKLSIQQLIDLSVDNLEYFANYRGTWGKGAKILNVLQDIGNGTGDIWYDAVKDFDFEGWALGSDTGKVFDSIKWLRRLLEDKKLEKTELVHILQKSPPFKSIVYTSAQRALRKVLGRDNFTITFDSSSPFQLVGLRNAFALPPKFTSDENSWVISNEILKQDIRLARNEITKPFPFNSPLSKFMTMNNLYAHDKDDSDRYNDSYSNQLMVNHNLYTYHKASIDACDLIFSDTKKDETKVPSKYLEICNLVEQYFTDDNKDEIEKKLEQLTSKTADKEAEIALYNDELDERR